MNTMKLSKSFKLPNVIFVLLIFVRIILITSLAVENENVASFCSRALIALGLALFVLSIIEGAKKLSGIFGIFLIYLIYILTLTSGKSSVNVLAFILMVSTWQSAKSIDITDKMGRAIVATEVIQGLIFIYISFTSLAYKTIVEYMSVSEALTLGFSNPNQTGIILFSTIAILSMTVPKYIKNDILRLLIYCEAGYLLYLLFKTEARTSIIAAGIVVAAVFMKLDKYKLNKHPYIVNAIPLLQLPFCYLYSWLSGIDRFKNMEFLGKQLFTGREELYTAVLTNRQNGYLIGNVNGFMFENLHNAALTIFANIGLIGIVLYYTYTLTEFNKHYQRCYRGKGIYAIISILALFILGYGESAALTMGSYYYINLLIFVAIAANSAYEEENTLY